jgi:hypothetical protein
MLQTAPTSCMVSHNPQSSTFLRWETGSWKPAELSELEPPSEPVNSETPSSSSKVCRPLPLVRWASSAVYACKCGQTQASVDDVTEIDLGGLPPARSTSIGLLGLQLGAVGLDSSKCGSPRVCGFDGRNAVFGKFLHGILVRRPDFGKGKREASALLVFLVLLGVLGLLDEVPDVGLGV